MRLKSIKLAGFKSFVDPTTANFPYNMTAVVGPNGCGKSNIIDAVRWVMGESSAKHLRGESMSDVIFNGSNARKPVTQASIELVFDNSEGKLGGEYGRFSEISVKRQVNRDGQSHYYLNGAKCRRKDITDIFLGTGLGSRSYSIVEQGTISRLIEAKPAELRTYIEEAAGISRYKERRRETENRIRRTRENLERLTDIREELDRQLERLSRQASAAEKYKRYKEEERETEAQLTALRWRDLNARVSGFETSMAELEVQVEARTADQHSVDAELERQREKHTEVQERFNGVQQQYYELGSEVARLEQTIQHQRERKQQLSEELAQVEESWRETSEHLRKDGDQIAELDRYLRERNPELEEAQGREEASAETLATADEAMQNWQQEWDEFQSRSSESRRQAEVEQSRIQHLEQSIERLDDRIGRLEQERESLDSGPLAEEMRELERSQQDYRDQQETVDQRCEDLQQRMDEQRQHNSETSDALETARSELQQARDRHTSLEALQKAAMGDDGAVSDWLQRQGLAEQPRLADRLRVSSGWEGAVEAVLGTAMQAVCVDGLDPVETWLSDLEYGDICLVSPAAPVAGGDKAQPLAELVSDAPAGAVAGVYTAETLSDALALRTRLDSDESVVTRDGIWLGPDWLRCRRLADTEAGILERRQQLEELDDTIAAGEEKMEQLRQTLDQGRERMQELEQEREEARQQSGRLQHELGEVNAQVSAREVRLEQINQRKERLGSELDECRQQRGQEEQQLSDARGVLSEALDTMERDNEQRETLMSQRDELRQRLDDARDQARRDRDRRHELALDVQQTQTQADSLRSGLERLDAQVASLSERKNLLQTQLEEAGDPDEEIQGQLEEKLEARLTAENQLKEVRRELETVDQHMRELEQQRQQYERQAGEVRQQLDSQRLEWQELKVRRSTLQESLNEQQQDLDTLLQSLPEQADESEWAAELEQIRQRISRLGQINLAAIDEYQTQSERKAYLDQQDSDLNDALQTLENAIRKIDKETRTRFKECFDQINKGFQGLFPKVFGGGHAYLELTGEDLLDTGVTIMARPPGKRNSTIHLLSGGEKALTALSLVFAIFELNPAPFCMLDEVDAPLDDANVGRFCNLVRELSNRVQFIYITHNKVTIEMAASLMGVTMQEPGVSRLVAVDVDEAAELAAM